MRGAYQRADPAPWLWQLVIVVDNLKLAVQLAKDLEACKSFKEFQAIAEYAVAAF